MWVSQPLICLALSFSPLFSASQTPCVDKSAMFCLQKNKTLRSDQMTQSGLLEQTPIERPPVKHLRTEPCKDNILLFGWWSDTCLLKDGQAKHTMWTESSLLYHKVTQAAETHGEESESECCLAVGRTTAHLITSDIHSQYDTPSSSSTSQLPAYQKRQRKGTIGGTRGGGRAGMRG